jgi:hypothetical protein
MNIQYSFLTIALLYSVTLIGQTTDIVTMGAGYIDQSFKIHFIDFYDDLGEKGHPTFEIQQL